MKPPDITVTSPSGSSTRPPTPPPKNKRKASDSSNQFNNSTITATTLRTSGSTNDLNQANTNPFEDNAPEEQSDSASGLSNQHYGNTLIKAPPGNGGNQSIHNNGTPPSASNESPTTKTIVSPKKSFCSNLWSRLCTIGKIMFFCCKMVICVIPVIVGIGLIVGGIVGLAMAIPFTGGLSLFGIVGIIGGGCMIVFGVAGVGGGLWTAAIFMEKNGKGNGSSIWHAKTPPENNALATPATS